MTRSGCFNFFIFILITILLYKGLGKITNPEFSKDDFQKLVEKLDNISKQNEQLNEKLEQLNEQLKNQNEQIIRKLDKIIKYFEKKENAPAENGSILKLAVDEVQGDAANTKMEEEVKEIPVPKTEEIKEEEVKKEEEKPTVVAEKIEEIKVEEATTKTDEAAQTEEVFMSDNIESLGESISKLEVKEVVEEISEFITKKVESVQTVVKETMEQVSTTETITNGVGETNGPSNEVVVAE